VIIVVDNDGNDPAVPQAIDGFAQALGLDVRYLVETQPGISAARNAVFTERSALA
jgi:succinoglycan biosynthesis protein ExoM